MSPDDVARACSHARSLVLARYPTARAQPGLVMTCHVLWMLDQIAEFMGAMPPRREKAMRWLGFVQGYLWTATYCTIEDLKKANRPSDGAE